MGVEENAPDLSVQVRGHRLSGPVWIASGIYGYETEYEESILTHNVSALCTRAITGRRIEGDLAPRIVEVAAGLLNNTGLAGTGVRAFSGEKAERYAARGIPVIANIVGENPEEYSQIVRFIEENAPPGTIWGYEVNVSYPTAGMRGLEFGTDPKAVEYVTRLVRAATDRPVFVKITPNVTDIAGLAVAAEQGGADGVSCINTLVGMAIDIDEKKSVLSSITGGLSGPALLPVGLAAVYRVSRAVTIPVSGVGGVTSADDAIQYLLAGATCVQVGSALFGNPEAADTVARGIVQYAARNRLEKIDDFHQFIR